MWNIYFADVRTATARCGFTEKAYADDLNCYKDYPLNVPNDELLDDTTKCQAEIHKWGRANQVEFDPGKESKHVLSRTTRGGFQNHGGDL